MTTAPAWDSDWIDACLMRGERKPLPIGVFDPLRDCRWCTHQAHGLECSYAACDCESTWTCRDDSWRPRGLATSSSLDIQMRRYADQFGIDGYIARLLVSGTKAWRLKRLLLMQGSEGRTT